MLPKHRGHVNCYRHHRHHRAGLVPRECAPHCLEGGDVLAPTLVVVLRDTLGGPQVGPQGVAIRSGRHGVRVETGYLDDSWGQAGEAICASGGGRGGAAYAALQGAAAMGHGGGCTEGAGCGAWARLVGAGQGAGAGAIGQGIGNDAWWVEWPGGYWGGGVVG